MSDAEEGEEIMYAAVAAAPPLPRAAAALAAQA